MNAPIKEPMVGYSLHRVWDWTGSGWGYVERWLRNWTPADDAIQAAADKRLAERMRNPSPEVAARLAEIDRSFNRNTPDQAEQGA